MDKFEKIPRDEQETIIHIDYYECVVTLYTTRENVYKRLKNKLGEADEVRRNKQGLIESAKFKRSFANKQEINKLLSRRGVIGSVSANVSDDAEDVEENESEEE